MAVASDHSLRRLLETFQERLAIELGLARKTIGHPSALGTATEDLWIKMLAEHLPERYAVNRAFVIDAQDGCSEQIDVVIHDRQYSPFVLKLGDALYIPAESVYAVIEVRQVLNLPNLKYAGDKAASVRRLHRTSLPIKHAGGTYPAKPLHHILSGVVTLESEWSPPFGDALTVALEAASNENCVDLGCVASHGVFNVTREDGDQKTISVVSSDVSLALFLLRLIQRLQDTATVPCIDVMAYASRF